MNAETLRRLRADYIGVLIDIERRKSGFDPVACDHIEDLLNRWAEPEPSRIVAEHNRGDHYNGQPGGCPSCPADLMEPDEANTPLASKDKQEEDR